MKTYVPKKGEVTRGWHLIDLEGKNLGRTATKIAMILMGKTKPTYTPNIDVGDFVAVVNAGKFEVTGNKMTDKLYYRHSGYPGGLKETSLSDMLKKHPERVIKLAVAGMLPKNKLRAKRMKRLKIFTGPKHNLQAQKPVELIME
ncbi:MAG: 50S ribosomal protein L13 [Candidatus Eremiobacteraeota bacterium]|nr:50S ribosomal protein L13 [Candidatus Eremiobacteraeota bacterium]